MSPNNTSPLCSALLRTIGWGVSWLLIFSLFSMAHAAPQGGNNDGGTAALILILICLAGYFFPTIVANCRRHNHIMAIFCTNLFLGWTFIGWVIALVWACMNSVKSKSQATSSFPS